MAKKRVLFISDAVAPTGFSTVAHNIITNLPTEEYEVHHLGVNYRGDPHNFHWAIYPASLGGDIWGFRRIPDFAKFDFDFIFILNDVWVINTYLEQIKKGFGENIPPVIVYFPVDSMFLDKDWFQHFDIVTKVFVYTYFGYEQVKPFVEEEKLAIMPHGIDPSKFYRVPGGKFAARKELFPARPDFQEGWIVLNANRNQPRKRVDLSIEGFALFAEDKPENVKLYLHMGMKDMGWDIIKLTQRYKIDHRVILTNTLPNLQTIPIQHLNTIYNACDVGLNTSLGEGWSLTNMEHASIGGVQVVPNHSALTELYQDCGILIPVNQWLTGNETLTVSGMVSQEDVAEALQTAYDSREDKLVQLSKKSRQKFSSDAYKWENIVENILIPIFEE